MSKFGDAQPISRRAIQHYRLLASKDTIKEGKFLVKPFMLIDPVIPVQNVSRVEAKVDMVGGLLCGFVPFQSSPDVYFDSLLISPEESKSQFFFPERKEPIKRMWNKLNNQALTPPLYR